MPPHPPSTSCVLATVWFDGGCPLCRREIALMRRLDRGGRIRFVDISPPEAAGICPINREELLARFHAQEGEGPIVSGAEAFAVMWRAIPLLRPFGTVARWPPVRALLDGVYEGWLRVRPVLQRLSAGGARARPQAD